MADISVITCPECGKEIKEPGRFCPHCAAPLPQPEQDPNVGYWNFYGALPEPEPEAHPGLGKKGVLRFISVAALFAGLVAGMAASGFNWGFHWDRAWPFFVGGAGLAIILFLISFLIKPPKE